MNQLFSHARCCGNCKDGTRRTQGLRSPDPCQRMRFSRSKLDKVGEQTRGLEFTEASQNWVGNSTSRRNQYHAAVQWKSSYPSWELIALFLRQNRRCRREWKTRDPRRVRLSTSNLSQRCETIRNIAAKLPRNRTAPMVSRGLVPDDVRETL